MAFDRALALPTTILLTFVVAQMAAQRGLGRFAREALVALFCLAAAQAALIVLGEGYEGAVFAVAVGALLGVALSPEGGRSRGALACALAAAGVASAVVVVALAWRWWFVPVGFLFVATAAGLVTGIRVMREAWAAWRDARIMSGAGRAPPPR